MRTETRLFAGVAAFFLVTDVIYTVWSMEPAGIAVLTVAFLMSALLSFFFGRVRRRDGERPEDRPDGAVADRAGPLDFFPPNSPYPVLSALGVILAALGVVFGLWLFLLSLGLLLAGLLGLVFQYVDRDNA